MSQFKTISNDFGFRDALRELGDELAKEAEPTPKFVVRVAMDLDVKDAEDIPDEGTPIKTDNK